MLDAGGASDSEDDLATANAAAQNSGRTTRDNTTAKSRAMGAARRGSTATATKRKAPTKPLNRLALKDWTNIQHGSDAEDVEEGDDDYGAKSKSKRAKTTATQKSRARSAPAKSKTTRRAPAAEALAVIPETQPDPQLEDISQSIEGADAEMDVTSVPTPPQIPRFVQRARSTSVQPVQPLQVRPSARSASVQPGYPPPRERSGSASGTERERRGGDPELRRQLNEVTKKHENLKLKYQNLEDVAQTSAQSNFEQLKRASAEKAKTANETIAALKKEVAELKKSSSSYSSKEDSSGLQRQVNGLTSANDDLTTETANLKSSLQVSQNEVKSLEAKLVAARQQLSNMASGQENNKNASDANAKSNAKGSAALPANATDAQREAKMKENLYSDLTGLIIRGVKRKEGEDEYDCIQTGRNGSTFPIPHLP